MGRRVGEISSNDVGCRKSWYYIRGWLLVRILLSSPRRHWIFIGVGRRGCIVVELGVMKYLEVRGDSVGVQRIVTVALACVG